MLLYTNKEQSKRNKKTNAFTIAIKKKKQLVINLTTEVKDLYSETYKIFMKETEADRNECKYTQCSWIGRMTIIKIIMLPMAIYRFNTNPVISSMKI